VQQLSMWKSGLRTTSIDAVAFLTSGRLGKPWSTWSGTPAICCCLRWGLKVNNASPIPACSSLEPVDLAPQSPCTWLLRV